jgi:hypothetical protein
VVRGYLTCGAWLQGLSRIGLSRIGLALVRPRSSYAADHMMFALTLERYIDKSKYRITTVSFRKHKL